MKKDQDQGQSAPLKADLELTIKKSDKPSVFSEWSMRTDSMEAVEDVKHALEVFKRPLKLHYAIAPTICVLTRIACFAYSEWMFGSIEDYSMEAVMFLCAFFCFWVHVTMNKWKDLFVTLPEEQREMIRDIIDIPFVCCSLGCLCSVLQCLFKFFTPIAGAAAEELELDDVADMPGAEMLGDFDKRDPEDAGGFEEDAGPGPSGPAADDAPVDVDAEVDQPDALDKIAGDMKAAQGALKFASPDDGFMGFAQTCVWVGVYFGIPIFLTISLLFGIVTEAKNSDEDHPMGLIILYLIARSIYFTILIYYIVIGMTTLLEIAVAARSAFKLWEKEIFDNDDQIEHYFVVKQYKALTKVLADITGPFTMFIFIVLVGSVIIWTANVIAFYEHLILTGEMNGQKIPPIAMATFIFILFAVTLVYVNSGHRKIISRLYEKDINEKYFELRTVGWKLYGIYMTHELYVKLITVQAIPLLTTLLGS